MKTDFKSFRRLKKDDVADKACVKAGIKAALKGYAVHPSHVAVANGKVRPFTQTRLCLDYEI